MKHLTLIIVFLTLLNADRINKKTIACPSVDLLQKTPLFGASEPLAVTMYAIANECVILSKYDLVETIGYDPRSSKEIFQNILYKKENKNLYVPRSSIIIEKSGKKNKIRF